MNFHHEGNILYPENGINSSKNGLKMLEQYNRSSKTENSHAWDITTLSYRPFNVDCTFDVIGRENLKCNIIGLEHVQFKTCNELHNRFYFYTRSGVSEFCSFQRHALVTVSFI